MEKILKILEENARISLEDIATMVESTPEEVAKQIDAYQQAHVINGYKDGYKRQVLRQKAKRLLQQRHDPLAYPTALRRTGDACCPVAGCIADTRVQPVDAHQGFAVIPGTGTGGQTFAAHARYWSVKIDASHFHHLPCRRSCLLYTS